MRLATQLSSILVLSVASSASAQPVPLHGTTQEFGVVFAEQKRTHRGTFQVQKIAAAEGMRSVVIDERGRVVSEADASSPSELLGADLAAALSDGRDDNLMVDIWLLDEAPQGEERGTIGSYHSPNDPETTVSLADHTLNGRAVTREDLLEENLAIETRTLALQANANARLDANVQELHLRERWSFDDSELESLSQTRFLVRNLRRSDVRRFAEANADLIAAMDLHQEPATETWATAATVANALPDPYPNNPPWRPGQPIGWPIRVFQMEYGCPPSNYEIFYPSRYPYPGSPDDSHARHVYSIIFSLARGSFHYCVGNYSYPNLNQGTPNIINMSARNGVYSYYSGHDRDADNYVMNYNVAFVKSAGNEGNTQTNKALISARAMA